MGVSGSPFCPSVSRTQISSASSDWSPILVSCTGAHTGASPGRPYKLRTLRNQLMMEHPTNSREERGPARCPGLTRKWQVCAIVKPWHQGGAPKPGARLSVFVWHNQRSIYQRLWLTPRSKASPLWADGACVPRWHCWLVWKKQNKYMFWRTDKNETEKDREFSFPVTESYPKQPVIKVPWWRSWSHAWGWWPSCVPCSVSSCGASWWEDALHQGILWENLLSWQEVLQIIGKSGQKPEPTTAEVVSMYLLIFPWVHLPWNFLCILLRPRKLVSSPISCSKAFHIKPHKQYHSKILLF